MKNFSRILIFSLALALVAPVANAQKTEKQLKKELNSKVKKAEKKQAKQLKKQGWTIMPGSLPLERQLRDAQYAELDVNAKGERRYFIGKHQAIGGSYNAAKQIADTRARGELAQSVYQVIAQTVEDRTANRDYGDGDIDTMEEFISAHKSVVSAQLKGVVPVMEIYRKPDANRYEVMVLVKMDAEEALKLAKRGLYDEMKTKSQKMADDLDVLLPW